MRASRLRKHPPGKRPARAGPVSDAVSPPSTGAPHCLCALCLASQPARAPPLGYLKSSRVPALRSPGRASGSATVPARAAAGAGRAVSKGHRSPGGWGSPIPERKPQTRFWHTYSSPSPNLSIFLRSEFSSPAAAKSRRARGALRGGGGGGGGGGGVARVAREKGAGAPIRGGMTGVGWDRGGAGGGGEGEVESRGSPGKRARVHQFAGA